MSDYLNRTGSIIVLLTLMVLSVILSTQFSFGRLFARASQESRDLSARGVGWLRRWIERRRKDRERREVVAKHTKKGSAVGDRDPEIERTATGDREFAGRRSPIPTPIPGPAGGRAQGAEMAPPLPLPEPAPVKASARRNGAFTLPPPSLLDAAKVERKIDERELMEAARQLEEKCREFAVEGQVAQIHPGPVVTTFEFKPEAGVKYSKITGLADDLCLAMQAESVLIDRIPGQVHGRHPDSQSEPRGDLAARAARIRRLPAIAVEADAGARQDDPRRAVPDATSRRCRTC